MDQQADIKSRAQRLQIKGLNKWFGSNHVVKDLEVDVAPGEFLPAAERYHLMPDIDRWVIRNVFDYLNQYWDELATKLSMISINLSGQSLNERGFAAWLVDELRIFESRAIAFALRSPKQSQSQA